MHLHLHRFVLVPGSCLHQGLEQRRVVAYFRVPLDPDKESTGRLVDCLDRLYRSVVCSGAHDKAAAYPIDGLVVVGGNLYPVGPYEPAEQAAGDDSNLVNAVAIAHRAVAVVANHVRKVLVQRAAARDVQDLDPPADCQNRDVVTARCIEQLDLE